MHGVDYIIPDFRWLVERDDIRLHGICFTHGHEDHIGAVTHLVKAFPDLPLYATRSPQACCKSSSKTRGC